MISDEQRAFGDAMCRWLEIRHEWDYPRLMKALASGNNQLQADAWHSALIRRLLAGKEPLPKPPPLRHSGPWYELAEDGVAIITERHNGVAEFGPDNSIFKVPTLLMEGSLWVIEDRYTVNGAPAWRVRYDRADHRHGQPFSVAPWRASVEYTGMRSFGVGLTREAVEAYRRRGPGVSGLLTPEELASGRPAALPYWQPAYRVTITE